MLQPRAPKGPFLAQNVPIWFSRGPTQPKRGPNKPNDHSSTVICWLECYMNSLGHNGHPFLPQGPQNGYLAQTPSVFFAPLWPEFCFSQNIGIYGVHCSALLIGHYFGLFGITQVETAPGKLGPGKLGPRHIVIAFFFDNITQYLSNKHTHRKSFRMD